MRSVISVLALAAALALVPATAQAQAADGVTVTTDVTSYAPGDPIQVTITNGGPDRITRGGLDCDDLWPLALEQQDDTGNWQPVQAPRHGCIGIAGTIVVPGDTQTHTISLPLDPGTYHVSYAFSDVDAGTQNVSVSDPFTVDP